MMHGGGKSDPAIVVRKPTNNVEQSAAEPVERRAGTKGNANQHDTHRTPSRASVTQGLERIRLTAKERKKEKFTALLEIGRASCGKECSLTCRSRWSPYH